MTLDLHQEKNKHWKEISKECSTSLSMENIQMSCYWKLLDKYSLLWNSAATAAQHLVISVSKADDKKWMNESSKNKLKKNLCIIGKLRTHRNCQRIIINWHVTIRVFVEKLTFYRKNNL
jgi:hypothetical protein